MDDSGESGRLVLCKCTELRRALSLKPGVPTKGRHHGIDYETVLRDNLR